MLWKSVCHVTAVNAGVEWYWTFQPCYTTQFPRYRACFWLLGCIAMQTTKHKMRPTVTDVPESVCLSACLSVGHSREAHKNGWTHINVPFGVWTHVGPKNHVFDEAPIPMESGNFEDMTRPVVKYKNIRRSFDVINLIRYVAAVMRPLVARTATTCLHFSYFFSQHSQECYSMKLNVI